MVLEDISKLWNISSGDYPIVAVQDCGHGTLKSRLPIPNYKKLGLDQNSKYFNAGVLIINLAKWRDENLSEKIIRCIERNINQVVYYDQYGFNVVLNNRWKEINPIWNQVSHINSRGNPYIIHFIWRKPIFKDNNYHFTNKFFNYLDMTEWRGWRPTFLTEFVRLAKKSVNLLLEKKIRILYSRLLIKILN